MSSVAWGVAWRAVGAPGATAVAETLAWSSAAGAKGMISFSWKAKAALADGLSPTLSKDVGQDKA
jgi:hypothetical protein